jgi:16S rRNA (cytosine1402-N4)-methyltransferase
VEDALNWTHIPVLWTEVLVLLDPRPGGRFIDATVGGGGHSKALLDRTAPDGRILGLDRDESALAQAAVPLEPYGSRAVLVKADFRDIETVAAETGFLDCDGVLADIGVSSGMFDDPDRGFSIMRDGPLDMRMDRGQSLTAADVVNTFGEKEIADILFQYGEERRSRPIARSIVRSRPISTTGGLVSAVRRVLGGPRHGHIHPATRTFQGLRIFVNDELGSLDLFLGGAMATLRPGGRLAVISFHSLEDRIVKNRFRAAPGGRAVTKKVVMAQPGEVQLNPRARSARLRAWERADVQRTD